MDERSAIERLLLGDISGLDELMRRYQVQAVRAAYLVCQDRSLAEDIVQSAFVRAYERIHQFESSRPFGPWFLRSVINSAIQAVARERRTISIDLDNEAESAQWAMQGYDIAESLERLETASEIRTAIAKLPAEQRAAIVLRYYLDLTDDEISARVNSPPSTVRWRLHAGRKRLRSLLPPWLQPGNDDSTHGDSNKALLAIERQIEKGNQ
jgi:RNA polymerase sigma-70 factor (ECF subfamily)